MNNRFALASAVTVLVTSCAYEAQKPPLAERVCFDKHTRVSKATVSLMQEVAAAKVEVQSVSPARHSIPEGPQLGCIGAVRADAPAGSLEARHHSGTSAEPVALLASTAAPTRNAAGSYEAWDARLEHEAKLEAMVRSEADDAYGGWDAELLRREERVATSARQDDDPCEEWAADMELESALWFAIMASNEADYERWDAELALADNAPIEGGLVRWEDRHRDTVPADSPEIDSLFEPPAEVLAVHHDSEQHDESDDWE